MSFFHLTRKAKVEWKRNVEQRLFHCGDCASGDCATARSYSERGLPVPAHGAPVMLFAENVVGLALLRLFRRLSPNPVSRDGQVKPGLLNRLATFGLRVQFLTGRWSYSRLVANGITNTGKAALASRFNGSGGEAAFTSIGIGTDSTAFAATQTALLAGKKADATADSGVHALATGSVTATRVTTTVTNDTAQLTGSIAVTGSMTITESGVFNADTNGVMACRQTFSGVAVANGDTFVPTWKVSNS